MTITYKVLGQQAPAATTATSLYVVPSSTSTVISTISICNQAATAATFSLAVRPSGEALAAKHYLNKDTAIPGNDSIAVTIGITLAATDVVTIISSTTTLSFTAFGSEIT